jgi:hypothetical protein
MNEEQSERNEIYSRAVKAGKRTYFMDVKATRGEELYLTITESKKRFNPENGQFFYEKHKIFLYGEDFEKFIDGLQDVMDYVRDNSIIPIRKTDFSTDFEETTNSDTNI